MSEFEFIVRMTEALGWPVFALIIVLILRRPIRQMLTQRPPTRMKAGPFEVEWDRVLSEAETEIEPADRGAAPGVVRNELAAEAATAPPVAVLEAHATVERALRELLAAADVPEQETRRAGAVGLARLAQRKELISHESVRAIEGVSVLRNLAAHGSAREITAEQANEYLALVDVILFALRRPR